MRRSPAENYTKYLIVLGKTNEEIRDLLLTQQLDYISTSYMERLRTECTPPKPFYPHDKFHPASRAFLSRVGVNDFFHPTKEMKLAKKILASPRMKEFIEAMALAGAPPQAIAVGLSHRFKVQVHEKAVTTYHQVFWNLDLVDTTEIKTLLARRAEVMKDSKDPDAAALAVVYKKASYSDPRRIAAGLPHSPVSAMLAQMRMGSMPTTDRLAEIVEMTRVVSVARAFEISLNGSPADSAFAMNYAITAEKMGTILEQIIKPDEQLVEQLGSIALRTEEAHSVPTVHALSAGAHTIDMQPKDEEHDPVPPAPL